MPTFESTVRQHRVGAGLSQEALARLLGVSRQTVVNIERGESEPRVFLALAMAAISVSPSVSCSGARGDDERAGHRWGHTVLYGVYPTQPICGQEPFASYWATSKMGS